MNVSQEKSHSPPQIVSTETDPRAEGHPLLEPFPGSAPADKGSLSTPQGDLLEALKFLDCLPVGLGFRQAKGEIHAWLHNNFRHQSDWPMVSLYPSATLLSKNQLAKEPRQCGPHG